MRDTLSNLKSWINETKYNPFMRKEIDKQLEEIDRPLQVYLAGVFNAGKSSFINAVLEEDLLQTDKKPKTSAITRVMYGSERGIEAKYKDGQSFSFPLSMLGMLTAEDSKLQENLEVVNILLEQEILRSVNLVDSPGINAKDDHTRISEQHHNDIDVVFYLSLFGLAGSPTEVSYVQSLKEKGIPVFGFVNYIDDHDEEYDGDLDEYLDETNRKFRQMFEGPMIGISAKLAREGQLEEDEELLDFSNWSAVEKVIEGIKENSDLKTDSHFTKMEGLIRSIQRTFEENEKDQPLRDYDLFLEYVKERDFQELLRAQEDVRNDVHNLQELQREWGDLSHVTLRNEEELDWSFYQFKALYQRTPILFDDQESTLATLEEQYERIQLIKKSIREQEEVYIREKQQLEQEHHELLDDWSSISGRKIFGVREISHYEDRFVKHIASRKKLQQNLDVMEKEDRGYVTEVSELVSSINNFFKAVQSSLEKEAHQESTRLQKERNDFLARFPDLSSSALKDIQQLIRDRKEAHRIFEQAFTYEHTDSIAYHEALFALKQFGASHEHREISGQAEEDYLSFFDSQPGKIDETGISNIIIQPWSSLSSHVYPPRSIGGIGYAQKERELMSRQKWLGSLIFAAIIFFFLLTQTTLFQGQLDAVSKQKPVAEARKHEPLSESAEKGITSKDDGSDPVEIEKAVQLDSYQIENFMQAYRDDYFIALNQKDFSYVSGYLTSKGKAYIDLENYVQQISDQTYHFLNEQIDVMDYGPLNDSQWYVSTSEQFTFEEENGDKIHYQKRKQYTLVYEDENIFIEEIETLDSDKQKELLETATLTNDERVFNFTRRFIDQTIMAKNHPQQTEWMNFVDENSPAYQKVEKEIMEADAITYSLLGGNTKLVEQIDAKHYRVHLTVEEKEAQSSEQYTITNTEKKYIVAVDRYGELSIADRVLNQVIDREIVEPVEKEIVETEEEVRSESTNEKNDQGTPEGSSNEDLGENQEQENDEPVKEEPENPSDEGGDSI